MEIKTPVSRWKQVAEYLKEQIQNGTFPAGQLLPSEQQLAEEFGLSRPTIRNAINELKAAGLVEVQRPRGTIVRSPLSRPAHIERRGLTRMSDRSYTETGELDWHDVDSPTFARVNATVDQAHLLGIPAGEPMLTRTTVQSAEQITRLHRTSVPFSVAAETPLADDAQLPASDEVYALFDGRGRLSWEEFVRARMPLPDEAQTLRAASGVPVLHITRMASVDKHPVAMEEIVVRGDALEVVYGMPVTKTR
ncbi:GntR family transcriptional regulator [Streptosporangiaceae bacterium NEAU-GS5]|nr:GntR family transcriptional regulator [Streptosporangiaceae bacterium NEAU-GS5]